MLIRPSFSFHCHRDLCFVYFERPFYTGLSVFQEYHQSVKQVGIRSGFGASEDTSRQNGIINRKGVTRLSHGMQYISRQHLIGYRIIHTINRRSFIVLLVHNFARFPTI